MRTLATLALLASLLFTGACVEDPDMLTADDDEVAELPGPNQPPPSPRPSKGMVLDTLDPHVAEPSAPDTVFSAGGVVEANTIFTGSGAARPNTVFTGSGAAQPNTVFTGGEAGVDTGGQEIGVAECRTVKPGPHGERGLGDDRLGPTTADGRGRVGPTVLIGRERPASVDLDEPATDTASRARRAKLRRDMALRLTR